MRVGPVELMVLVLPPDRAVQDVTRPLTEVVERGYVTVLDLVVVTKTPAGDTFLTDSDGDLRAAGLGALRTNGQVLISEADLALVREALEPSKSAAVIAYEQTWARDLASAVRVAGGEVALHVQVPSQVVDAALAAAFA